MVCDTPYRQNEFGDPDFFYVFNLVLSFSTCSQSFKKICTWELLGANVLNISLLREIPYPQAAMYYLFYYINILITTFWMI